MNRTIGGLPLIYWIGAIGVGVIGFLYFRKKAAGSPSSGALVGAASAPQYSQQQEVQDFQIFSALTSQQQASDLSMLGTLAGLFSGGSSPTTPSPTPSPTPTPTPTTPSPPPTGTAPPATTPAPKQPGYGTIQTAQGQMVWLGVNQAGQPIYNVGGGAPVYWGNASALAQGPQYEQPGYDIYTPLADAGMVSANTSILNQPYVG